MNHKYRMKFLNESRITAVKQDMNHEYPKSNDSASSPENPLDNNITLISTEVYLFTFNM